jgi:RHS repeat-associated protein
MSRMRTDWEGNVVGTFTSLPFGDAQTQTTRGGDDTDANHFATLDTDSESNTDHAQYRQYSSTEGRWMRPDPYSGSYDFSNPQSLNRYIYAANNPLSNIDPSGLDWCDSDEGGGWDCDSGGGGGDGLDDGSGSGDGYGYGDSGSDGYGWGGGSTYYGLASGVGDGDTPTPGIPPINGWACASCEVEISIESATFNYQGQLAQLQVFAAGGAPAPNNGTQVCTTALTGIVKCQTLIPGPNWNQMANNFDKNLSRASCVGSNMATSYTTGDNGIKSAVLTGIAFFGGPEAGVGALGADVSYEGVKAAVQCILSGQW